MLEARAVTKAYNGVEVLHAADITLAGGKVVGLVGANGAGKTTTIKILAGLIAPTSGTAKLSDVATTEARARARIGYLPEDSPLYDDENPLSYLRFFGALYGMPRAQVRTRSRLLLEQLQLEPDQWKKPIGHMSKGMRRKVAIARTLLHDPDVVLLDEPTSGLDPFTARQLDEYVQQLRDAGKAVLLSAHNLTQVEQLCDEIIVVHAGSYVARGPLAELRKRWGRQRYLVRASVPFEASAARGHVHEARYDDLERVEAALETIRASDGVVLDVESEPPSLAEILAKVAEA